jgi:dihydrofolate reductase
MEKKNKVFIATSLDGYIADKEGGIEWLQAIPNPDNLDRGYSEFMSQVDALVMGRNTFETVCGFDVDWPYQKPVFVLSNQLTTIPAAYQDKVTLVKGALTDIIEGIYRKECYSLYIDGVTAIQNFLKEDLIDEITITTSPIILGSRIPSFSELVNPLHFECVKSKIYLKKLVKINSND